MLSVIHLLIAVVEFFVINWLGRHSIASGYHQISFIQAFEDAPLFDFTFRVISPTIFLALSAAVWYAFGMDGIVRAYWHVTLLYFTIRWAYNLIMGRVPLLNWWKQSLVAAIAVLLSYVVSEELLIDRTIVLPSARGLSDELWIVVIGFLYVTAGRVTWPALGPSVEQRRRSYLGQRYVHFQRRYGKAIGASATSSMAEVLVYAIIIYESFNRPSVYQFVEKFILFPIGVANTLGPMQVTTGVRLPNEELVRMGVRHANDALAAAFAEMKREQPDGLVVYRQPSSEGGGEAPSSDTLDWKLVKYEDMPTYQQTELVRKAAAKYNIRSDYPGEVTGIFEYLREAFYPTLSLG
jgi:hypothetical protein